MTFVTVRGARFHTVELGSSGPPLVMLHGLFTGSLASWYLTVAPVLTPRHRIRLLDWRGHGLSERTPSGYGSMQMASDLDALTEDLEPFAIVGHSFGAIVAARFAIARPDRITRLVLVEPPLIRDAQPWWTPARSARLLQEARSASRSASRSVTTRRAQHSEALCGLVEETTLLSELEAEPPLTDAELRMLPDIPALLVVGTCSPFRPAADAIARSQPRIAYRVLPGGHELHVDARGPLADLLARFLEVSDG